MNDFLEIYFNPMFYVKFEVYILNLYGMMAIDSGINNRQLSQRKWYTLNDSWISGILLQSDDGSEIGLGFIFRNLLEIRYFWIHLVRSNFSKLF